MKLTEKIIKDCKEVIRLCNTDVMDMLGSKEEFEEEKGGWTNKEIEMIEKDVSWQEAHGACLEEDGSISI